MSAVRYEVVGDGEGNPSSAPCTHLDAATVDPAGTSVCEDCVREGTQWVHLRACLVCGHVACCDNSPRRHATAHFHGSAHPLMRSVEPGEEWAWCYVDELFLEPAG